jgi:hypothetical protein
MQIDEIDQAIETPVSPPRPELWEKLVPVMMKAEIGQVITYDQMNAVLGHGSDVQRNRSPYYRALIAVQEGGKRTFECVRGEGYRRVHPNEHTRLAEQRTRLARHHLGIAEGILNAVDENHLTPHEAREVETHLEAVQDNIHSMDGIQERVKNRLVRLAEVRRAQEMKLKAEADAASGAGLAEKLASA